MKKLLPKGWVETSLDNLFNLVYGKGISAKELAEESLTSDNFYWVYGANGIIGKYEKYTYEKSKVIISCRGAASGAIHKTLPYSFISSNSIVLDEIHESFFNIEFIKYVMTHVDKTSIITGTAQPQITIQLLKNLQIPLPPLPEQERIVAKLDKLFAQHEKIKKALDRIPQLLKAFRQQVLTQAVTGKLTEQWREGKHLGVRAKGKQHSDTGEIDTSSLTFLELVDYHPKYDEDYLNNLIEKASDDWSGIADKDAWLREIRGGYDG